MFFVGLSFVVICDSIDICNPNRMKRFVRVFFSLTSLSGKLNHIGNHNILSSQSSCVSDVQVDSQGLSWC